MDYNNLVAPMAHFMRPEDDWNEFFADPKRVRQGMQRLFEAEHGKRFALFQVRSPLNGMDQRMGGVSHPYIWI